MTTAHSSSFARLFGSSEPTLVRRATLILAPAVFIILGAVCAAQLVSDVSLKRLFDNIYWTTAFASASLLAWLGVRTAPAKDIAPKRWFAWALTAYAIGQVLWDVQVAIGWNPFPGPSDLGYVWLGPLSGLGLVAFLRRELSVGERRTAALDIAGLCAGVLALTLALYLPKRGDEPLLRIAFLVAYPVALSWAACVGVILALALHLRRNRGWILFLLGLVINGGLWLEWNSRTLDGTLADGTWFNAMFSGAALLQGLGALLFRIEIEGSARWERFCEGVLRLLPLVSVVLSAAAVIFAYTIPRVPIAVKWSAQGGALVVVLLASLRQSVLLGERERFIEERKRAEAKIKSSEERYRVLVEQAVDGIFIADAEGRYLDVNSSGAEMLGMTREELIGKRISDIVVSDEVSRVAPEIARLRDGKATHGEWRLRRKDGSIFWAEVTGRMLPDGRIQGIARDISDRKQAETERQALESQLRQSQKLEAVGSLAAGIAHDFNNVLSAIRGNADLAQVDMVPEHPAWKSVAEIRKATTRAAELVQQIVSFARPHQPVMEVANLSHIVDEVVHLLRSTLPASVELVTQAEPNTPWVLADATQLHQVLINLCTNAWQALEHHSGRIHIQLAQRTVPGPTALDLPPGSYAYIAVSDTGKGMTAEVCERVFEPFFTTKDLGHGTGLGLSVVHNIIKSHHGAISVESTPDSGTTFHVYLPAADAPPRSVDRVTPSTTNQPRSLRVFYVDDDEALTYVATRHLERRGHKVRAFVSPLDALATIRQDPSAFDVLVSDYNMPRMSGLKLMDEVKKLRKDGRYILTSGFITDDMRQAAESAGVQHLLGKPDSYEELCEAIARISVDAG